jgi:RNA polymerase sigma factor (sigma-70 family)
MRDEARGDAELVLAVRAGERDAFGILVERWFDRCWEVAWRILHDQGLAADAAQDALFAAWRQLDRLEQPGSFGGWVLRISRNRALDRLQRERRTMSTGDEGLLDSAGGAATPAGSSPSTFGSPDDEVVRAAQQELVWAAAAALGERDASLLDLHLRHGLEPSELAEELGITPNAAHQALFRLRNRLGHAVKGWLLWRGGEPTCVVLQAEVAAAGLSTFDARLVQLITNHAETCVACSEERARVTAPAALFGAVPLVLAPTLARAQALDALLAAGVPVPASWQGPDGPGAGSSQGPDGPPTGSSQGSRASGSGPSLGPDLAGRSTPEAVSSGPPEAVPNERNVTASSRVRVSTVALLFLLLVVGGLVRWGPGAPTLLDPVADAGAGETIADSTEAAGLGREDSGSPTLLDPRGSREIDGTAAEFELAPLPPDPGEHEAAPDDPVDPTPGEITPPAEPPGDEVPEVPEGPRLPEEEGASDETSVEEPGEEPAEESSEPEEPEVDPPTIVRLHLTDLEQECTIEGQLRPRYWRVEWETEDATAAHLDVDDGEPPRQVDPNGSVRRVCLPLGAIVELTATNEGGSVSATEEAIPG